MGMEGLLWFAVIFIGVLIYCIHGFVSYMETGVVPPPRKEEPGPNYVDTYPNIGVEQMLSIKYAILPFNVFHKSLHGDEK